MNWKAFIGPVAAVAAMGAVAATSLIAGAAPSAAAAKPAHAAPAAVPKYYLAYSSSGGYTTLAWTDRGRQLAIGYEFALSPPGSKRSWPYLGVRLVDLANRGHNLTTDSRLAWSKLQAESGLTHPTPLTCAVDLQVTVSADGTVVCAGTGLLRDYTPNYAAKTCPAVPAWASVGFVAYSTATGKEIGPVFQEDTSCIATGGVLWTSPAGDRVIGYYALGSPFATNPVVRFGVFSHGRYTPLPLPPTTTTVPATIAW